MDQKPHMLKEGMFCKIRRSRRRQFKIQFVQEAARRMEAMLAESQRISHLGSWDWDLATDQIQFSDEMFRLVGMIPGQSEINREAFLKFLNPDMAEEILREYQQEENYQGAGVEHQVILPDGTIRTVRTRVKIYRDENGIPLRLLGSTQDITSQKNLELSLKESEWRNRLISELTTDYVFILDVTANGSFKVRWISENMLRLTGWTPKDLADPAGWGGLFHPEDRGVFFDFIGRILSVAYMGSVECRTFHKEGYERWVRIFARPELDRENKITGIVGAVKDISESKKAEKALLEVNSNLEAMVEKRTRELLESRNQLRELTRQIVSAQENERHRISRELHDEAGQALVGLRFSLDSAYREMPKGYPKIRKRMKQSLTLVDQTLSRLRSLAYELRPPMLDLMGIYLSIKQLCQDFSEQTGIRVDYSGCVLDGLEDEISISLYRFVQEALTNAAKHAHPTKIQVTLNYHDGIIVASVRDNGQGISETWEPGLGLTGIKERFDFLNGQLEIGPSMPKGTLIQISLPWREGVSLA